MDISDVHTYIQAGKDALGLFRQAYDLLPKGSPERAELEAKIEAAEEALRLSDAELAKKLGYKLCKCTFPPQIMLWKQAQRSFVCPNEECGHTVRIAGPDDDDGRVKGATWGRR